MLPSRHPQPGQPSRPAPLARRRSSTAPAGLRAARSAGPAALPRPGSRSAEVRVAFQGGRSTASRRSRFLSKPRLSVCLREEPAGAAARRPAGRCVRGRTCPWQALRVHGGGCQGLSTCGHRRGDPGQHARRGLAVLAPRAAVREPGPLPAAGQQCHPAWVTETAGPRSPGRARERPLQVAEVQSPAGAADPTAGSTCTPGWGTAGTDTQSTQPGDAHRPVPATQSLRPVST